MCVLLSNAYKQNKGAARDMLKIIMRYLAVQGLAMRRKDPDESNIIRLLQLRSEDNPALAKWLLRSSNTLLKRFLVHLNK